MNTIVQMLPQLLIDGLTLGFVYAIVALGYTMVYGILEFINFAHSEIFMVGAFAGTETLLFLQSTGALGSMPAPLALLLAVAVGIVFSGLLGVAVERIAYKPVRHAPKLVAFISAIGVSFFLQDAVRLVEGLWKNAFYLSTPTLFSSSIQVMDNMKIPVKVIYIVAIAIVMMLALHLFVSRHKWGKAMRTVAQDKDTASLVGINVDAVISLTFLIGAGLGGAAGTLFSVQYTLISPYVGFILGMKAFTAAVLGGIGSIPGAMLGGLLLGLVEVFGAAFLGIATNGVIGAEYKDVLAFTILIIILIFKPSGLLGRAVEEKV
ncbi:branched-chain amino acid ABC transporter permease [Desulfitobacterium chlororespirans]|uniref:Branched-chain amino acid transport system permease protein n=1 Tax=Desulfitobacterium chlororespirans DSM 11544 TaxID=1121395 RepID=A0A1M7SH64_9FIRM|nr:branched-chain amino acid ABC transporter permease [Desulfitobacterium chlororespirans]SHN57807.1 branched-chain amino acid transport system permease protein [Desulfitobacterium chlororespirans DSM 11544]